MANFGQLVLTNLGIQAQTKAQSGEPLKFKRIGMGSGRYSGNVMALTKLVTENVSVTVSKGYVQNNTYTVEGFFSNDGLQTGFAWREIGLFVEDASGNEILYCYANAGDSYDYIPATADERYSKYIRIATAIGNATNVSIVESEGILYVDTRTFEELRLEVNQLWPSKEASGKSILIKDSANLPLVGLNIYGKSTQHTTTGAQLFDFDSWAKDVYITHGTKEVGGNKITLTATEDDCYTVYDAGQYPFAARIPVSPNESYVLSWETDAESSAKNEVYAFFNGVTDGMKTTNAANKVLAFTAPSTASFITIRFGVRLSGDSASYWNIQVNKGSEPTAYEMYTGRAPSPSPEYPQEIESVGDDGNIEINLYGANLLNFDVWKKVAVHGGKGMFKDNGVVITAGDNGDAYTNYSTGYSKIPCVPGVKYVLSWEHSGANGLVYIFPNGKAADWVFINTSNASSIEYTPVAGVEFFTFRVGVMTANATATYKNIRINIKKDVGFEEYKIPQSIVVDTPNGLPGIRAKYAEFANYIDEEGNGWTVDILDLKSGLHLKHIHKVECTGDEAWADSSSYPAYTLALSPQAIVGLCSHMKSLTVTELQNGEMGVYMEWSGYAIAQVKDRFPTLDDFKAFLAEQYANGTPFTLLYSIETPVETALTSEQISAYKALVTNNPCTTVLNDAGAEMKVQYITNIFEPMMKSITPGLIGAVPDGYGLGSTAKQLTATDNLDNITAIGWYAWGNNGTPLGVPDGLFGKSGLVLVQSYCDNTYVVQNIIAIGPPTMLSFYHDSWACRRAYINGAWGELEWENPPMVLGQEYRTTERWNGNPVYTTIVDCGNTVANTKSQIKTDIACGAIIRISGRIGGYTTPYIYEVLDSKYSVWATAHNQDGYLQVNTYAGADTGNIQAQLQVWYTK